MAFDRTSWMRATMVRGIGLALAAWFVMGSFCGNGGPILGDILSGLTNNITTVIQNATASGETSVLVAAGSVTSALNNFESSFASDLNNSIDQLNTDARNQLTTLQTLVDDLKKGTADLLHAAVTGAQQLINTLPFANLNPQVTSYSPIFVASPPAGTTTEITINGNFFWAFQQKLTPTMQTGGVTYQPNLVETQQLGFALPGSAFAQFTNQLAAVSLELDAPYKEGVIFKSIKPGVFRLLVTSLPQSPVQSLTLTTQHSSTSTITNNLTYPPGASASGGELHQDSFDCQTHIKAYVANADIGFTIVPTSAVPVITFNKNGVTSEQVVATVTNNQVVLTASTYPNCFLGISNGSGDIYFYVTYVEQKQQTTTGPQATPINIRWGDQLSLPVTPNQWMVHAVMFDGTIFDATDTNHTNQYLSVTNNGPFVQIKASSTKDLSTI